jgi:hypothetical protein
VFYQEKNFVYYKVDPPSVMQMGALRLVLVGERDFENYLKLSLQ